MGLFKASSAANRLAAEDYVTNVSNDAKVADEAEDD
jgi:hypothetical protein